MNYDEFWNAYHREDPNEALDNPHRLTVHLSDGSKHPVLFPGTVVATRDHLILGVDVRKNGSARRTMICGWREVDKVVPGKLKKAERRH